MVAISIGLTGCAFFKPNIIKPANQKTEAEFSPAENMNQDIYGPPSMFSEGSTEKTTDGETNPDSGQNMYSGTPYSSTDPIQTLYGPPSISDNPEYSQMS